MHIAPDFLLVGLLSPKTFTLRNMPPPLSICAEPKGEVAGSIIQKIILALLERGGPSQTVDKSRERAHSTAPHPPYRAPSPQGEGFSSLFEIVDSATPG